MLRANNRPILAYFDAIKNLRLRQLALILKTGYDPNLMVNARGQNGLQFMVNYFGATDAHFRLQAPINKAAYLSIGKLLLDSGLDANCVDLLSGETVIFDAIRFNDKDMIALLLNYSDFSVRNKEGETALMCAARFGSKQSLRMILDHLRHLQMDGYFLRQRNRFGLTALELARAENLDCAKVLTKHLITFGYHTSAVLQRSASHHQLAPRAAHYQQLRAAAVAGSGAGVPRGVVGGLYGADDSASDEFEAAAVDLPLYAPRGLRAAGYKAAGGGPAGGFYDPKAAEFSQYLMEQQERAQQQQLSVSDLELDEIGAGDEEQMAFFGGGSGGQLTRSRSCILGPAPKQQPAKLDGGKKAGRSAGDPKTSGAQASGSWETTGGR